MQNETAVEDFKKFMKLNRERMYQNAEKADEISVNDEWMKEDLWDEIYREENERISSWHM